MELDDLLAPLSEPELIILEKIKKTIAGLTVREARQVLLKVIREVDDDAIVDYRRH